MSCCFQALSITQVRGYCNLALVVVLRSDHGTSDILHNAVGGSVRQARLWNHIMDPGNKDPKPKDGGWWICTLERVSGELSDLLEHPDWQQGRQTSGEKLWTNLDHCACKQTCLKSRPRAATSEAHSSEPKHRHLSKPLHTCTPRAICLPASCVRGNPEYTLHHSGALEL